MQQVGHGGPAAAGWAGCVRRAPSHRDGPYVSHGDGALRSHAWSIRPERLEVWG
jgi:hypothetical protein